MAEPYVHYVTSSPIAFTVDRADDGYVAMICYRHYVLWVADEIHEDPGSAIVDAERHYIETMRSLLGPSRAP